MARQSISHAIARRARRSPDEVVAVDRVGELRAADLDASASATADALLDVGVRPDDTVIVALPNTTDFVIACAAVWRAGATPMPLSPGLPSEERNVIEQTAEPRAAFGVAPGASGTHHVAVRNSPERPTPARPDTPVHPENPARPDIPATSWKVTASSGSTGRPKLIRSSAPSLVDPDIPVAAFLPNDSVQLITAPLWHSATFTYAFRGLTGGHRLVIEPKFDERTFLELVDRHGITWALLAPPSIHRLIRLPEAERRATDLGSLVSVVHLGGRCPIPDKRALIDWLGPHRVVEVYAGSESNGLTMIDGHEWLAHPGSVGRPIGGTHLEIRDTAGAAVPAGSSGTVWMHRGNTPHYTYIGADSRRDETGWDTLGDIGYLDDQGYLYIRDRSADVIDRGGITIYPADIEQAFEAHPAVRGAVAVGDHDRNGATVVTVTVDVADSGVSATEVGEFADRLLAAPARPDRVCLTHQRLRNDAGKIRRRNLRRSCGETPSPNGVAR